MQVIIYQAVKNAMQSGKAKAGQWILEVESDSVQKPDVLMGWIGGKTTASQVKLKFPTKQDAVDYASKHYAGQYVIRELAEKYAPPVQSYPANFAYSRNTKPWTH